VFIRLGDAGNDKTGRFFNAGNLITRICPSDIALILFLLKSSAHKERNNEVMLNASIIRPRIELEFTRGALPEILN
jgi:hypothetical protein